MRVVVPFGLLLALLAAFALLRPGGGDEGGGVGAEPPPASRLVLSFPGAAGWHEEEACTDVDATDACDGEWTHALGQKVRVLLVPVVDPQRLALLTKRLRDQVEHQGGVVAELPLLLQGEVKAVRMLQPLVRAEDNVDVVNITYLLAAPDRRLLHLVTSLVPLEDQVEADQRLRDLLAFGAWIDEGEGRERPAD